MSEISSRIETKARIEFKDTDSKTGAFKAYASVFNNVDSYGDVVIKGAFQKSLTDKMPKLLLQHNPLDPIGVVKSAYEDENGLVVEGVISNTTKGKDVLELLRDGALDSMSIGFYTVKAQEEKSGKRLLQEVDLLEVSFVTFPANELAKIQTVKSDVITVRRVENALNTKGGVSRSEAKRLASILISDLQRDVVGQPSQCDADVEQRDADFGELLSEIKHLTSTMKDNSHGNIRN